MSDSAGISSHPADADRVSFLGTAQVLLRRRRTIALLAVAGGAAGLFLALRAPRSYVSEAIFLPQSGETSTSGLAAAASQLGIRIPSGGGGWGPPMYVELLESRALLEPLVTDTFVVAEDGGRRIQLLDLLVSSSPNQRRRIDAAVSSLQGMVNARELRGLTGVEVKVSSSWASVSHALTERLLLAVNRFNLQTRQTQASVERRFVEGLVAKEEAALRNGEGALQAFMERNRAIAGSPELALERERLQREVNLRQQVYNNLVQSREEARIREVRDTPVIAVFEHPRLPLAPESRKPVMKTGVGLVAGALAGVLLAFLMEGLARARRERTPEAREFFQAWDESVPRFLRSRSRPA